MLKSGWLPVSLFLLFTFISNVLNQHGRILFSAGFFVITEEGLNLAAIRAFRVFLMIGSAKILIVLTEAEAIIKALGTLLGPFEKLHLPVKDFIHTMGLTLQCFPVLQDMITENYRVSTGTGKVSGLWNRAKAVSMFLLPMFVKSIQSPESFFEGVDGSDK